MKTYQDMLNATDMAGFIMEAITEYKMSPMYEWACDGNAYARQKNTTIMNYRKFLYTMSGKAVPDNYSANHKCASNFFNRFITQENQYLLGNGVTFNDDKTKDKLGGSDFDTKLQKAGKLALAQTVSHMFFNLDHVDVFAATEYVPLIDEEDGSEKAGIRFWQIDPTKPMRATHYTLDGYTDYIQKDGKTLSVLKEKRPYKWLTRTSVADGEQIYDFENYPNFPIVPLWANQYHQSLLVGLKENIDCYDLIKSGFANDLDDATQIYWILQNANGMDDVDLAKFLDRLKTVKAVTVDGDGTAEPHTIEVPYQSRQAYLERLEADMYNDAMALNVNTISAGGITATAIQAAYEPLNEKTDEFEYCVVEAIQGILELIGIEDEPTFKRSKISNMSEETTMILQAAEYLDDETILKHLPFISPDEIDEILKRKGLEEFNLLGADDETDGGQEDAEDAQANNEDIRKASKGDR